MEPIKIGWLGADAALNAKLEFEGHFEPWE